MTERLSTAICATVIAIAAVGCSEPSRAPQSGFSHLPDYGWAYGDTVVIRLDASADAPALAVRHTDEYPYRNLWLEISQELDSATTLRDTVNIELCNAYGRWHGNGFGGSYQIAFPLPRAVSAQEVNIRHIMRVDTLRGLTDVGIVPLGS